MRVWWSWLSSFRYVEIGDWGGEQLVDRADELRRRFRRAAAEGCRELFLQRDHDFDRRIDRVDARPCQSERERTRVARVVIALDEAVLFEGAHELGDEDGI